MSGSWGSRRARRPTAAQKAAQRAMNSVGARYPRPERCEWCREFRGLCQCSDCRRWFCWRHIDAGDYTQPERVGHACPGHPHEQ